MDNLITDIVEALDTAARRKRAIAMKRAAPKIARKRKLSMKKRAGKEKLEVRAKKAAIELLRKRILKDKSYKDLPPISRQKIDKKIEGKKALIARIAKKLMPQIKKQEKERLAKTKSDK